MIVVCLIVVLSPGASALIAVGQGSRGEVVVGRDALLFAAVDEEFQSHVGTLLHRLQEQAPVFPLLELPACHRSQEEE